MSDYSEINCSLVSAVCNGRLEDVRKLIDSYGLSHSKGEGYVLLQHATERSYSAIAELLITRGSKVNPKNKRFTKMTPLHFAVLHHNLSVVKMLVNNGANIEAKNEQGQTPLNLLCMISKELEYQPEKEFEIAEFLLYHGANVNARNKDGLSLLHDAVNVGHLEIIKLLLENGANSNIRDKYGRTPLHIAARNEYFVFLHFATIGSHEETVELLLNKGADINASSKDNSTPLIIASKKGGEKIVKVLLRRGAEVNNQDVDGKTALHLAVEKGYLDIVEDILKYHPDINNESNKISLKTAVHNNDERKKKIVDILLQYGFKVEPEDTNDSEFLHAAVKNGYIKIVEDLLKCGVDVNMLHNSTSAGFTPLHSATKNEQEEITKLLISYNADINAKDKTGKTPLFYAVESTNLKITKLLLRNKAAVKDSPELLNTAVEKECFELLLQHDIDVNCSDEHGRTALYVTALNTEFPRTKGTDRKKGEIAKLLLNKGANVNAQTKYARTTLCAAIQEQFTNVVEALLEYDANLGENSDTTPLYLALETGNEKIIKMLLNKGEDVNSKYEDGITPLHIAAEKGFNEVVKILLEHGAKVDSQTENTVTPLQMAASHGYHKIIETLLEFGADIDLRDEYFQTAFDLASKYGHVKVVETLLDYGSDIKNHFTHIHYKIVDTFLRHTIKMKTVNLRLSQKNLLLYIKNRNDKMNDFENECKEEVEKIKSEKIKNANISFYDMLTKDLHLLIRYMRNENVVQVLKSNDYKSKFPIYANLIKSNFREIMDRKDLLEQINEIIYFLFNNFPEIPDVCVEEIFRYLSNKDLKNIIESCKLS